MIRVVAAVIEHRERLLICQRRAGGVLALQWEFPGGKMFRSETPRAALQRELREELGISALIGRQIWRVRHSYSGAGDSVQITFFSAALPAATLTSAVPRNLVFERIRWVQRWELPRYDFLPADRLLIARLVRGEL